jgi:hypothetical protein
MTIEQVCKEIEVKFYTQNVLRDETITAEPIYLVVKLRELTVDSNFTWYVVEKNPTFVMYKVVGLHRRRRGMNCVYLVGKDSHTNTPWILRAPHEYLKSTIKECLAWNIGVEGKELIEV